MNETTHGANKRKYEIHFITSAFYPDSTNSLKCNIVMACKIKTEMENGQVLKDYFLMDNL